METTKRTDFKYNHWYSVEEAKPEDFFEFEHCIRVFAYLKCKKTGRARYDNINRFEFKHCRYAWGKESNVYVIAWQIPKYEEKQ